MNLNANLPLAVPGILFVDDEENVLQALRRLFHDQPVTVFSTTSAMQALEILRNEPQISLLVSDQRMPEMSGAELLEAAAAIAPHVPRMLLTGYSDLESAIAAINRGGACRYLCKPWNDEDLRQTILAEIESQRLRSENLRLQKLVEAQNIELKSWNNRLRDQVMEQTAQLRLKLEEADLLNRRLQESFETTIRSFSSLLELRDSESRGHARTVAELACRFGRAMGLDDVHNRMLQIAGLLHDVGKIGTPDRLLHRDPESLEPDERIESMLHTVRGQAAIGFNADLRDVGLAIRHHHEAFDGSGFPDGLAGSQIPLSARIIALSNAVARLAGTAGSEIRTGEIADRLRSGFGTRFDPQLAPYLESVLHDYFSVQPLTMLRIRDLPLRELVPGMILAQDLYSGSGLLLLTSGTELAAEEIESLRRFDLIDPFRGLIRVKMSEA